MMVGQARPPNSSDVVSLFGIAADQQHLLALLRHHVGEVGEREALADAALAVDRDDLRLLGGRCGGDRIGFDRRFRAQAVLHAELNHRRSGAGGRHRHWQALQSRIIFRQARIAERRPIGRVGVEGIASVGDETVERQAAGFGQFLDSHEVRTRATARRCGCAPRA